MTTPYTIFFTLSGAAIDVETIKETRGLSFYNVAFLSKQALADLSTIDFSGSVFYNCVYDNPPENALHIFSHNVQQSLLARCIQFLYREEYTLLTSEWSKVKNFVGADLQGLSIAPDLPCWMCDFTDANLARLEVRYSSQNFFFDQCTLTRCILDKANLTRAIFHFCELSDASFKGAIFSEKNIPSNISAAQLSEAIVLGRDLNVKTSHIENTHLYALECDSIVLDNSSFQNVVFGSVDLRKASLQMAVFEGCLFNKCKMAGIKFSDADISNSRFMSCNLDSAEFKAARLSGIKIAFGPCLFMNFSDAKITDSELERVRLSHIITSGAHFSRVVFDNVIFKDGFFNPHPEIDSHRLPVFDNCVFRQCTFIKEHLGGIDFSSCVFELSEDAFQAVTFDNETKGLPEAYKALMKLRNVVAKRQSELVWDL